MSDFFAHPTSIIDAPSNIGTGTKIWHFSHVSANATLGKECNLGQNVYVAPDVVIGDHVKIQNNVSIYTGTVIEDDVFLGPSCVLTNVLNPRSEIVRRGVYEKTLLRRGCTIGANATIVCGTTLGRYCFIAAGSVVTRDVPDYAFIVGVPGRQKGYMSRHGFRMQKADSHGFYRCPRSGHRYQLIGEQLRCLDLDEETNLPETEQHDDRSYREQKK